MLLLLGSAIAWPVATRAQQKAMPGDIPVELPTTFELVIDLKTAKAAVRRLADARALRNSPTAATELKRSKRQPAAAFFPHEYLVSGWRAFYASEIRTEMAKIDLAPVGSATLMENFDSFILRRAEREALAEISVTALNRALTELGGSFAERPYVAMPFGTAIGLEPELWRLLWHGGPLPDRLAAWPGFLSRHLS